MAQCWQLCTPCMGTPLLDSVILGMSDVLEEEPKLQLVRALPHPHTVTNSACGFFMACAGG